MAGAGAKPFVDQKIKQRPYLLFSKSVSPECTAVKEILGGYKILSTEKYEIVEIDKRQDCTQIQNYFQILCLTDTREVPQFFVKGKYIGGEKEVVRLHLTGNLGKLLI